MKSEALKINVAKRVLGLSDDRLLEKISKILDEENIVGYDAEGKAVTHEVFMEDLEDTLQQLEDGTLETYTTEEVKQMIFGR